MKKRNFIKRITSMITATVLMVSMALSASALTVNYRPKTQLIVGSFYDSDYITYGVASGTASIKGNLSLTVPANSGSGKIYLRCVVYKVGTFADTIVTSANTTVIINVKNSTSSQYVYGNSTFPTPKFNVAKGSKYFVRFECYFDGSSKLQYLKVQGSADIKFDAV